MIQTFADWLVYDLLQFQADTKLGGAVNFFVYDSIKIILLLYLITFVMGFVNARFPVERLRDILTKRNWFGLEYLLAALFGAVTPFCSCSSVPLFIGFVRGGIPLGVTLSFLITSPLVNEVALAMFLAAFGWKVTAIYAGTGIALGVIGGAVLARFKLERLLAPWLKQLLEQQQQQQDGSTQQRKHGWRELLPQVAHEAQSIVAKIWLYVLGGIAIGAAIHGYVPAGYFENVLSADHWYAVPLAVMVAVPMYANAAGVVPIIQVLIGKGVALGTGIAFMMAVVGLSLPEAMLLKRVMSWKLILIFFGTTSFFMILSGYFFNAVL